MMDDLDDMEAAGLYLRNGEDIDVRGLRVKGQIGPVIDADQSVRLQQTEDGQ
ncbi:MAG: hypothetical protein IH607_01520 [Firmicutes bacterium]|nr:hypothetical protein [Bacillota bacterium]